MPIIATHELISRPKYYFCDNKKNTRSPIDEAWQRIHYAPTERIHLYMECDHLDEIRDLAEHEGWPPDTSGSLVILRPTYRTSVWHGQSLANSKHPPTVSDIQLILDLWHHADRGRETAEQLWRPILRRFEAANASMARRSHMAHDTVAND